MGDIDENSSVLCTSATIASTCCRFFGRGVSDAAALSFSVRGCAAEVLDAVAFFEGFRAGNPLSTRFLAAGFAGVDCGVSLDVGSAGALSMKLAASIGATAANTAASTEGDHAAVPLLVLGVVVSC